MHMNVVSKNIVHSINLDDIWIYDHKYENAWATREKEKKTNLEELSRPY